MIHKIEIEELSTNLKDLIFSLKVKGIKEENFNKVLFELDYRGCYYESDTPKIVATINTFKNK